MTGTYQLEISEGQRERFDRIREACKNIHVPAPDDEQMMKSLMDTWDAVADGFYSDDIAPRVEPEIGGSYQIRCPRCSTTTGSSANYCRHCGAEFVDHEDDQKMGAIECPEHFCESVWTGIEELEAHLRWDHNRSEYKAEKIAERAAQAGTDPAASGDRPKK